MKPREGVSAIPTAHRAIPKIMVGHATVRIAAKGDPPKHATHDTVPNSYEVIRHAN